MAKAKIRRSGLRRVKSGMTAKKSAKRSSAKRATSRTTAKLPAKRARITVDRARQQIETAIKQMAAKKMTAIGRSAMVVDEPKPAAKPKPTTPTLTVPADLLAGLVGDVPRVRGAGRMLAASPSAAASRVSVAAPAVQRMIALPPRGLRTTANDDNELRRNLMALHSRMTTGAVSLRTIGATAFSAGSLATSTATVNVVGSIAETGAKLIEYPAGEEGAVRAALPGLRLVPEVFYEPLSVRLSLESNLQPSGSGQSVQVTVRSATSGNGIPHAKVVAFTNFALRMGAEAFTNSTGVATLAFAARPGVLERLYAFADRGFWSALRLSIPTSAAMQLDLTPIDLSQVHPLRHYFGEPALTQGSGVNVGVIDTGSGPHPDLVITNGFNAVTGEVPTQFGDNGDLHGTHVAGIIGSRGSAPNGVRGIAPGVTLFSYRVFPKGSNASNFDIANAIDKAREQGCDLINLSLGRPAGGTAPDEPLVRVALEDARAAGMLAIAAAGNDFRRGVSFPAADDLCIAVSALGDRTLLLKGSVSASAEKAPAGTNPNEFIGDFSNIGPEIDVTGPGVGVVSTVPQQDFAVMDGTSMACPAVTGVAARLLGGKPAILGMARDSARATAIANLLLTTAQSRGFTPNLEGRGLPQ
jgi:subtilisin